MDVSDETTEQMLNLNQLLDTEKKIDKLIHTHEYLKDLRINNKT
jgi:hypothetical protein